MADLNQRPQDLFKHLPLMGLVGFQDDDIGMV